MEPDRFYEHEPSEQIVCGDCASEAILDTKRGRFTGDEATYPQEYRLLQDDDTEPYQCESCNKQNDAYDSVLDE